LNNNKLINEKLICAFRWSVLPSIMKMHGPKNKTKRPPYFTVKIGYRLLSPLVLKCFWKSFKFMAFIFNKTVTSCCLPRVTVYKRGQTEDSSVGLVARKRNCQTPSLKFSVILANNKTTL